MIAETETQDETQCCSDCLMMRPLSEFRFRSKARGERHSRCNHCRREAEKLRRQDERERTTRDGLRHVRRASTPAQIIRVLEGLAHRLGGTKSLIEEWARLCQEGTPNQRLKSIETALFSWCLAELQKTRDEIRREKLKTRDDPDRMVRHFLQTDRAALVKAVRGMLDRGDLTLDDLDPPPGNEPE